MSDSTLDRRFCVAPMLDWSDRHCRVFWRQLSRRAVLYTEMVTTGALLHGDQHRHLQFSDEEQPLALQLGGSDPGALAASAALAEQWGYNEVNLNCGCPSDRVQNGFFGACLMARPSLVADCVKAMCDASSLPVTVKHRIGIDDQEGYGPLRDFVGEVQRAGCNTVIVHARKAWLQGLSPKENREIPPLNYPMVYQLKREFNDLEVIINGGIASIDDALSHLSYVDGSMLGRSIYQNPYQLAEVDQRIYGDADRPVTRQAIVESLFPYIEQQLSDGARLHHITRHILGLFNGLPGARQFRRHLSQHAHRSDAGLEILQQALALTASAQQRNLEHEQRSAERPHNGQANS
ncbi:tRNA dihydrouridine(20/20a) synthase DusA [Spongiibacter sp.]|uniref:tRNA dihydrouridine(20/20a) synthase DusA n=1 Tax=Spongiibacter sp. TaxID=2024860 RepID=UPI0035650CA3